MKDQLTLLGHIFLMLFYAESMWLELYSQLFFAALTCSRTQNNNNGKKKQSS